MGEKTFIWLALGISLLLITSSTAAQDQQWLQYHMSAQTFQILDDISASYPEVVPEKPKGVTLPDFKCDEPFFAFWSTPMVEGGGIWMAFDRKSKSGPHDLLYIDLNQNNSLSDEYAIKAHKRNERNSTFGPVKILFEGEDGPITYHLNFKFYRSSNRTSLALWPAGWYEGNIKIAGEKKYCMLIDHNVNGTFNDKSIEASKCDRIRIGKKSSQDTRYVGNFIEVDGTLYRLEVARDGAYINLTSADDVKFGNIRVSETIKEFSAGGENGLFKIKLENGIGSLSVGKYRINQWALEQKDEKGRRWKLLGTGISRKGDFEILTDKEIELSIGEPIVSRLEVKKRDPGYYSFNHILQGQLGERIELTRNGSRPPAPKLQIKSKNGSYNRSFSFEYG